MIRVRDPFSELERTPSEHFKLLFYAAVIGLRERLGGLPADTFPFLAGYAKELALGGAESGARWSAALADWERRATDRLPIRELARVAGLDALALTILFTVGLPEEDPRFGAVFGSVQGIHGEHRPTLGLLCGWWAEPDDRAAVRDALRRLLDLGLVDVGNRDAPRGEWALQPSPLPWDAARGELRGAIAPWAVYRPPAELARRDELVVAPELDRALDALPHVLGVGETRVLVVRGPQASGRRTLLGATARSLGCGLLEVTGLDLPGDERWRIVGPLATLLDAVPTIALEPAPGETVPLPRLRGCARPLGVALGRAGGVEGPGADGMLTLALELPNARQRLVHWRAELGDRAGVPLQHLAETYRMTGGNIRRVARLARSEAALERRDAVLADDVLRASRVLHSRVFDTLAERVPVAGGWDDLAVPEETMSELLLLEARCRHRERLQEQTAPAPGLRASAGVRALFSGPSGTGKTLAARLLASVLARDLYRLDLSTVVNKYLGETEKNLSRVFARAEELDVILLLDEGDALLTRRTDVQTANDRYANLETNYLLQRLESFEGILIVTTNAGERIDDAFERRMDIVVEFRAPDVAERWAVWELHLPPTHAVSPQVLNDIAARCGLTGGQIRNAALHAALLALEDGGEIGDEHLVDAVRREYRKAREVCPLRPYAESVHA